MTRAARLRRVRILATPGIAEPFTIEGFSPGVTVVLGSNASGKTSLCRALDAVLWPERDYPASLSCETDWLVARGADSAPWFLSYERGSARRQTSGRDQVPDWIPPDSGRDRYRIALHELLAGAETKDDFAREIHKQMCGGVDVENLRKAFSVSSSARPGQVKAYKDRQNEAKQAEDEARALHGEEDMLPGLRLELEELMARRNAAAAASARADFIEALLRLRRIETELKGFPGFMIRLRAEDARDLADAEEKAASHEAILETVEDELRQLRDEEKRIGPLPEDVERVQVVLRQWQQEWQRCEEEERELSTKLAGETAREQTLRAALGFALPPEVTLPDTALLRQIDELARLHDELRAADAALRRERASLEERAGEKPPASSALSQALRVLEDWQRAARRAASPPPRPWPELAVAALILAGGFAVAAFLQVAAGVVIALLSGLLLFLLLFRREGDERKGLVAEYEQTGMAPPEQWTAAAVKKRREELIEQQERVARWRADRERAAEVEQEWRQCTARRDELQEKTRALGAAWGIEAEADPIRLAAIAQAVAGICAAAAERAARASEMQELRARAAAVQRRFNAELEPFALPPCGDAVAAMGALQVIEERLRRRGECRERLRQKEEFRKRTKREAENCRQRAAEVRRRLAGGQEAPTTAEIQAALARLADWQKLNQERQQGRGRLDERRRAVRDTERLEAMAEDELDEERGRAEQEAAAADELEQRVKAQETAIHRIETLVEQARQEVKLQSRIAARDEARDELAAERARMMEKRLARVFLEQALARLEKTGLPSVAVKAQEHFGRLTHDSFHISFAALGEAGFMAGRADSEAGVALTELSSATRLHLLLSVRLGFLEESESATGGVRLPVVFDEAFANTDDRRGCRAVDLLIELAAGERQVIYLTASGAEAETVRAACARKGMACALIDLDEVRRTGLAQARPLVFRPSTGREIPTPDGMTRVEYAKRIGVDAVDPWSDGPAGIHLWHLVDDLAALYRLLFVGYERWGQWERFHEREPGNELVSEDVYRRAAALARAAAAGLAAWQRNRPRPVERPALVASGVLTKELLAHIDPLLAECGGDAGQLLKRLQTEKVAGLGSKKRERLQQWLRENDHLADGEPPSPADVLASACAAAHDAIRAGIISPEDVMALLSSIGLR